MNDAAPMAGPALRPTLTLTFLLVGATGALAAPTRPCSDPCVQAAKGGFVECKSSAQSTFHDAFDACIERDRVCVDACQSLRQDCRDATGLAAALLACDAETEAAKEECRSRRPVGSKLRERCIDRAHVRGFRCRRERRHDVRDARRDCRRAFPDCVDGCGVGGPPEGVAACRDEARAVLDAALASCVQNFRATAQGCLDRDITCVQDCADARQLCAAPTQSTLDAALTLCRMEEAAALAACAAANPDGGAGLQDCTTGARASAFNCREAAIDAAGPGLAACAEDYVRCVASCPAA